jgi:hypothetical protein
VDEGADQGELLSHAARKGAGRTAQERPEPGHRHEALEVVAVPLARHLAEIAEELDVLLDRQRVVQVQAEPLRHVAHGRLHGLRAPDHVQTLHERRSGVRPENATQDLQDGGLAGPVGIDEAEDLAASNLEGHVAHGPDAAAPVALAQPADVDRRGRGVPSLRRG